MSWTVLFVEASFLGPRDSLHHYISNDIRARKERGGNSLREVHPPQQRTEYLRQRLESRFNDLYTVNRLALYIWVDEWQ